MTLPGCAVTGLTQYQTPLYDLSVDTASKCGSLLYYSKNLLVTVVIHTFIITLSWYAQCDRSILPTVFH